MGALRPQERSALELHWGGSQPLPRRWVAVPGTCSTPAARRSRPDSARAGSAWDFSAAMTRLCADIVARCPELSHIRMDQVLVTFTPSRSRSRYGLQARVTPLRFRHGALTRRQGTCEYQVQRFFVEGREILYLITFCLPRFLDQTFAEKLTTVFHELYHINPAFNGDLRRHAGRYCLHTHSKASYDAHMHRLAQEYLRGHRQPQVYEFLRYDARKLAERHGGIVAAIVPRPKILPIGWTTLRTAARNRRLLTPDHAPPADAEARLSPEIDAAS
ncbi:MAG: putative metallopeptidase [Thermogemmata sp.]|uniref:Putative phage metallopeptidase domain-containing protein n=1 Tax=Thermogemmata fonticola TaxID=2755323 RepID=A0A7V9ADB9_9BACT|nr:putative metallopeptidase [Thermogemmata fonticola]MBA2227873.1 hypothetical protein [Thermogemmata fonticola]MCX8140076.1 putative metallopeptidase [Gemmataceae bacterium]